MLVMDNLSDSSVIDIVNNPIDFENASNVFSSIQELCISIRRLESNTSRQRVFGYYFWLLISKAIDLKSLSLRGIKPDRDTRLTKSEPEIPYSKWIVSSFPISRNVNTWEFLRNLELKRMEVDPVRLFELFKQIRTSIREVYLIEVFLKVSASEDVSTSCLWIGLPSVVRGEHIVWMAEDLRNLEGLSLDILRASGLGYDNFTPFDRGLEHDFDILDPLGLGRSFDQRFVDTFFQRQNSDIKPKNHEKVSSPVGRIYDNQSIREFKDHYQSLLKRENHNRDEECNEDEDYNESEECNENEDEDFDEKEYDFTELKDYDAVTHQLSRNSTSYFEHCIDNLFFNRNMQVYRELWKIIDVSDQVIELLVDEDQVCMIETLQDQIFETLHDRSTLATPEDELSEEIASISC